MVAMVTCQAQTTVVREGIHMRELEASKAFDALWENGFNPTVIDRPMHCTTQLADTHLKGRDGT